MNKKVIDLRVSEPAAPQDEAVDFQRAMRGVNQIQPTNRAAPRTDKPAPRPRPKAVEPHALPSAGKPSKQAPDVFADYQASTPLRTQNRASLHEQQTRKPPTPLNPVSEAVSEFAEAVGPAVPIDTKNRVWQEAPKPAPVARKRLEDEASVLKDALSDHYPWVDEDDNGDELLFLRPGLPRDILRKLRRGHWVVQAETDFHGCTVDEARERFGEFLRHCKEMGHRCIRMVHGKGLSSKNKEPVIKPKLRGWLIQREDVLAFCTARPFDGGNGAVIVLLRGSREKPAP